MEHHIESIDEDREIVALATQALADAQENAQRLGLVQVMRNSKNQLVRVDPKAGTVEVLKELPPRKKYVPQNAKVTH
jgi:hypothetical protein